MNESPSAAPEGRIQSAGAGLGHDREPRGHAPPPFEWAVDALLFGWGFYALQRSVLLGREGVIGPLTSFFHGGLASGVLAVLAFRAARLRHGWISRLSGCAVELGGIAIAVTLLGELSQSVPSRFGSQAWIAQEWCKLGANLMLVVRVTPIPSALQGVATAVFVRTTLRARRRWPWVLLPLGMFAWIVHVLGGMGADDRIVAYGIVFGLPWLALAAALLANRARWVARTSLVASATTMLLLSYAGLVPFGRAHFENNPGVRKVHPAAGQDAAFPLAFLRDFHVDASDQTLFTAFGPTSGIVRMSLSNARTTIIPTPADLVRHLRDAPGTESLYALEWVHGDLLTLDRDPFRIAARVSLLGPRRHVPMSFLVGARTIVVVFTEEPGLLEIDRTTGAPLRNLSFRDLGLTLFRSGAWEAVGDVDGEFLLVELGAVDARSHYRLARVNLSTFEVERVTDLPDGGLALARVPEHGSVITAGFFTDRLAEIDEKTLALRRTFRGPLNCRALAYDARRDLIYASAFLPGELWTLRHRDARVVRRDRVGNKSLSLALDAGSDKLYVGSGEGIFEVQIEKYLAGVGGP